MTKDEIMRLADAYAHEAARHSHSKQAEARAALEAALTERQEEEPVEPKCAVIVEVFGKDWRLEYMSLPVGRHKLYPQQFTYTHPAPSVNAQERISELEAQNKALTIQAFEIAVERDELRMELGDLPEAQAEMLGAIKALKVQNAQLLEQFELVLRNLEKGMPKSIQKLVAKESREAIAAIAAVEGKV